MKVQQNHTEKQNYTRQNSSRNNSQLLYKFLALTDPFYASKSFGEERQQRCSSRKNGNMVNGHYLEELINCHWVLLEMDLYCLAASVESLKLREGFKISCVDVIFHDESQDLIYFF